MPIIRSLLLGDPDHEPGAGEALGNIWKPYYRIYNNKMHIRQWFITFGGIIHLVDSNEIHGSSFHKIHIYVYILIFACNFRSNHKPSETNRPWVAKEALEKGTQECLLLVALNNLQMVDSQPWH